MVGVSISRVNFASREFRSTDAATDSAVEAADLLSEKLTFASLLEQESDAEDLRDAILAMRALGRDTWTVEIPRSVQVGEVGDTITINTPRFGITSGNFLIKGKKVSFDTPYSIYTLYGPE